MNKSIIKVFKAGIIIEIILFSTFLPIYAQNVTNAFGTLTLTQDRSGMKFKFDPSDSVKCDKIVFAQTVKRIFSNGGDVVKKSGDIWNGWRYKDPNTLSNGTLIDSVSTCEDPWVNGDDTDNRRPNERGAKEDRGKKGKKNASGTSSSEWDDYPSMPDGYFPAGKTKYKIEFEICVMCMEGDQAGTIYGCTTWVFERTKNGGRGASRHTGTADLSPPSSTFIQALDLWEENHINENGERFCPD